MVWEPPPGNSIALQSHIVLNKEAQPATKVQHDKSLSWSVPKTQCQSASRSTLLWCEVISLGMGKAKVGHETAPC